MAKKAYIGIGEKARSVKNIYIGAYKSIKNDVRHIYSHWIAQSNVTKSNANTSITFKETKATWNDGTNEYYQVVYPKDDTSTIGDVFYASIESYAATSSKSSPQPDILLHDRTGNSSYESMTEDASKDGSYSVFSLRYTSESHAVYGVRIRPQNSVTANDTFYFRYAKLFNLTSIFGAGNEPDKAWCDNFLAKNGSDEIEVPLDSTFIPLTVARKIKKAYIGVDGIAKLCYKNYSGLYYSYYRDAYSGSSINRYGNSSCHVKGKAFFAPGRDTTDNKASSYYTTGYLYDNNLTVKSISVTSYHNGSIPLYHGFNVVPHKNFAVMQGESYYSDNECGGPIVLDTTKGTLDETITMCPIDNSFPSIAGNEDGVLIMQDEGTSAHKRKKYAYVHDDNNGWILLTNVSSKANYVYGAYYTYVSLPHLMILYSGQTFDNNGSISGANYSYCLDIFDTRDSNFVRLVDVPTKGKIAPLAGVNMDGYGLFVDRYSRYTTIDENAVESAENTFPESLSVEIYSKEFASINGNALYISQRDVYSDDVHPVMQITPELTQVSVCHRDELGGHNELVSRLCRHTLEATEDYIIRFGGGASDTYRQVVDIFKLN